MTGLARQARGAGSEALLDAPPHLDQTPLDWLLEVRGVRKRYGGVHALRGVDFHVSRRGTVHALAGENGSGKSTLLGVLAGLVQPDEGSIWSEGAEVTIDDSMAAVRQHGIATVSQETALALDLSVTENVLMGRLPRRWRAVDWRQADDRAQALLGTLGMTCDPRTVVRSLRPDERQMVEIARALSMDPRILVLDEPTSSLTEDEVEAVVRAIQAVKRHDVATILVSHRLHEVFAVADEITVLRDGLAVAHGPCATFTADSLVTAMVGDAALELEEQVRSTTSTGARRGGAVPALSVRGLEADGLADVSLDVARGEIVGLAGLVGSGRGDLLRAIYGVKPMIAGKVCVGGEDHPCRGPSSAIAAGLGYVPPERKTEGLVLSMSVRENLAMVATARSRSGPFGRGRSSIAFNDLLGRLRVRQSALSADTGTLSGGNQQKIALAKWLATETTVLLLDEPTRGVDVVSRAQIHRLLCEWAATGASLLVSSSENPELLEICDRIVVMFGGRVIGSYDRSTLNEPELAALCAGSRGETP